VIYVKVGEKAPVFSAECYIDGAIKRIHSTDFKRKWIVLFFYPRDFSFICPTELAGFARLEPSFRKESAVLIGCSTDSVFSHKNWIERDLPQVKYPLLADTTHSIAKSYNVLIEENGEALRATFIIDPEGALQHANITSSDIVRNPEEILRVLQLLRLKKNC
jgi:alkyl hydroperoxide reductase subunit AhpC